MELLPETQQWIKELNNEENEKLAENQRQNEIVRQARIANAQKAKDAENAEREQERLAADEELKRRLRDSFLVSNPSATDEDFERLYPDLRDAHLIRSTEDEYEKQLASNRSKYNVL